MLHGQAFASEFFKAASWSRRDLSQAANLCFRLMPAGSCPFTFGKIEGCAQISACHCGTGFLVATLPEKERYLENAAACWPRAKKFLHASQVWLPSGVCTQAAQVGATFCANIRRSLSRIPTRNSTNSVQVLTSCSTLWIPFMLQRTDWVECLSEASVMYDQAFITFLVL